MYPRWATSCGLRGGAVPAPLRANRKSRLISGSIGRAVARRVSTGNHVVLADLHHENADAAAEVMLDSRFDVNTASVDVSSRDSVQALVETATDFGEVTGLIHAAGVSPSQASRRPSSPSTCMELRSCLRSSRTSSHAAVPGWSSRRNPAPPGRPHRRAERRIGDDPSRRSPGAPLSPTRAGDGSSQRLPTRQARQLAAVMAEPVRRGKRGARINTISPGIVFAPLARDELTGPRGVGIPPHDRTLPHCPTCSARPIEGCVVGENPTVVRHQPVAPR